MTKQKIISELKRLKELESNIMLKFALEARYCSDKQLRLVCKKIFEISDLILRLKKALAEFDDER